MIRFFDKLLDWCWNHLLCLFTGLCLLSYGLVNLGQAFPPPIRSDGIGYYAYLPALFIHGDPSFETLADLQFEGELPTWAGFGRSSRTGRYVNMYGVGVAIMLLPFFVAAHLLTYLFRSPWEWHRFNFPADGFSFFYQHAAGLGGMFYGLIGLGFLKSALARYFRPRTVLITLVVLMFGTNLLNYLAVETVLSHSYSFFLFSAALWLASTWRQNENEMWRYAVAGVIAGLIAAVRMPNVLFVGAMLLYGVKSGSDLKRRMQTARSKLSFVMISVSIGLLVLGPQLLMWRYSTGKWWANGYTEVHGEIFDWLHPKVGAVLFSMRGGLLFWSPVLGLCVPGFFALRKRVPDLFLPPLAFLMAITWLISVWHDWALGGGFGHRGFVESYALLAFPLAAFFDAVAGRPRPWAKALVAVLTAGLVCYSLFFQMLYYTRELSIYGIDRQALFDVLWWRKQRLENWWATLRSLF